MGIRFQCPNGHKLNVKRELAGKRASCPECGAKLVIPAATAQGAAASPSAAAPVAAQAPAIVVAQQPTGAVWHLRTAHGEQLGPVTELQFRAWIAAGRVTADSYVWREGWPQWQLARDAADQLPTPLMATPIAAPVAAATIAASEPPAEIISPLPDVIVDEAAVVVPAADIDIEPTVSDAITTNASTVAASTYAYQRQRSKKKQLALAVFMLAAVVVLAAVLIWVVSLNSGAAPATTSPTPTAATPAAG
jgi:hypothetical protein